MAERKNLVIKVKYPRATQANTAVITVWNKPRIGLVAGGLCLVIFVIGYLFSAGDTGPVSMEEGEVAQGRTDMQGPAKVDGQPAPASQSGAMASAAVNKSTPSAQPFDDAQSLPAPQMQARVRRAVLANRIINKEPLDEIKQPLSISPTTPITVYYFNELRGMNGVMVYHEWLHDGVSVTKEPLLVGAERWRVSSHKTLDSQSGGSWMVKLIDNHGNVLDEKKFTATAHE